MNLKTTALALATFSALSAGAIPQAPVITYGLVRDEYGNPMTDGSALVLKLVKDSEPDGQIYSSTVVGKTAYPGMNYRLSLEIDSTGPARSYAVLAGTQMRIRFLMDGEDRNATPSPVFATPENGAAQRNDFSLGADADGDGMPDAWEAWVLQCAGQPYDAAAVAAFRADADADGDGMSNGSEYLAGTDPFLATDLLEITAYERNEETGRSKIQFTTVPGRKYHIVTSATLENPVWVPVATTRDPDVAPSYGTYGGTGRLVTVYFSSPAADRSFYRVAAN